MSVPVSYNVILDLVLVPDPKPTPAWIAFSIARYTASDTRMRSGDETILDHLLVTLSGRWWEMV